ncbi:hypothetical protein A0J48_017780 [Sphaerospermopsis aphanizomenoides BCCUSP55]|uniref:hypothetical protein n=1 Tax=Sphaerospermopsis aphanizomenoides TaxID=459663 RepID=UPI001904D5F9|nr:hypothetical protein [Sphaerospermopsis aphanizomenoides]MBK1989362.1 hypothetical protein [Sphaerospermopsis aphanizomenoides BCCUSP55]
MSHTSLTEQTTYKRISAIVEKLIANNIVYQERLEQEQMINYIYELFNKPNTIPPIEVMEEEDLISRINGILVLHSVAGTLNDFTPEEMTIFDEAVKRK